MSQDILFTMTGLPNVVPGMNHEVEWKAWSHLDFLWGIDADRFWWKNQTEVSFFYFSDSSSVTCSTTCNSVRRMIVETCEFSYT